ncbi:hypothetical protein [Mesorhizobium sp. M7A.F.Ca.ET.027.03.2.1]|uniref:hypothetical protein n=1 Tax=Mesorhizobium sp. M7A.F.Ca.ET.027.03.2.1 TaxID=2496656 RepID=UPI000FCA5E34|nr:hypothetical protein [Mesorhizobium sp. M7A.F.Ca.ET.027.03.2.1]RVD52958.1 hypothetical protein EN750_27960 [Mesorhizobium sp. M7A.F.Ca.ET.027.03.2.1]
MASIYSTGTVSVTNGNAGVTGTGTAWALGLVAGGMFTRLGVAVPILSVTDDTNLTLAYPWPGATAAGAAYAIALENSNAADIVDLNRTLSRVLVTLSLAGVHPNASGTIAERDAIVLTSDDEGFFFLHAELGIAFAFYRWSGTAWEGPFPVADAAAGGPVSSLVAGANVTIDSTNPAIPVISASGTPVQTAVHAAASKATPVDADEMALVDSAASFGLKKLTWANLKAGVLAYFNGTAKATPVAADRVYIGDSAALNAVKYSTWTQILAAIFGTAALKNTGTSGNNVPLLDGANLFSGTTLLTDTLSISTNNQGLQITSYTSTPTSGPIIAQRARGTSTSPTAVQSGDTLAGISARGYGATAFSTLGRAGFTFRASENWSDTAQGTDMILETTANGGVTRAVRLTVNTGLVMTGATGGDKGAGTINATAVYDDNTLLTCMALSKEFIAEGAVDLEKWDAMVPDLVIPEAVNQAPVLVDVEVEKTVDVETDDGLVRRSVSSIERRAAVDLVPVWDEAGNGIDAIEVPLTETVTTPAVTVSRVHGTARVFKAMLDDGFDPRDPEQYFARLLADEALPGMPTQADWQHNDLSIGDLFSRKWLAVEMLAVAANVMWAKLKDHEQRLLAAGI